MGFGQILSSKKLFFLRRVFDQSKFWSDTLLKKSVFFEESIGPVDAPTPRYDRPFL